MKTLARSTAGRQFSRRPLRARRWGLTLALALPATPLFAVLFLEDTVIGPDDTSYDGQDLIIWRCTVTVDGPHTFANVLVADGGVLTHSPAVSGTLTNLVLVPDERLTLADTNLVALPHSNVLHATVRVTNPDQTVAYEIERDYRLIALDAGRTGLQRTPESAIPDGSEVRVSYQAEGWTPFAGMDLTVPGHMAVAASGVVHADGRGYPGGAGSGAGAAAVWPSNGGSGGGHGGRGGAVANNVAGGAAYGSALEPTTFGSGGGAGLSGPGGAGGGAIRLRVGGQLTLEGNIAADGAPGVSGRAGGGAGGSVWITAERFMGNGRITAHGGEGEAIHASGGGGGRIVVECATNTFTGAIAAAGGTGYQAGGAGTVLLRDGGAGTDTLRVHNLGRAGAITPVAVSNLTTLLVGGGAVVCPTVPLEVNQLTVESNSWLSIAPGFTSLQVTVLGDALLAGGGGVDAVGKGYPSGEGPGRGLFQVFGVNAAGGGGGHAGYGGMGVWTNLSAGGAYYGSVTAPTAAGSGGGGSTSFPGGAGGGAVRLDVRGTLQLDGAILADGQWPPSAGGGGGAGGSVWLSAQTWSGSGRVSANGGSALLSPSGGGSGGRIAVDFDTILFTGTITAYGGAGFQNGAAGTIYLRTNGLGTSLVLVDNGGWVGTNTHVALPTLTDLIIQGGARAGGVTSLRNLLVRANSQFVPLTSGVAQNLTVTADARIESGGVISLDGLGYQTGQGGTASGRYYQTGGQNTWSGGGGGLGGYGGSGAFGGSASAGGAPSGSIAAPRGLGGAGGGTPTYPGGAGGGELWFTVNGLLQLDGQISANGLPGRMVGTGGGAGGSLSLTVNRWAGDGQLLADGGSGDLPNGGGGSGGRIAVTCKVSNGFTGTISAKGGPGANAGAAGTIYLNLVGQPAQLIVDNGGLNGSNTRIDMYSSALALVVRGGAVVSNSSATANMRNLVVGSNGWITFPPHSAAQTWTITDNATLEAGGGIIADGLGATSGMVPGRYSSRGLSGGGGGHGGWGGNGAFDGANSAGGLPLDSSIFAPTSTGGAGGHAGITNNESRGGGALRVIVNGRLQLDGHISANGLPGRHLGAGGGAGGSVYLNVNHLSGSGHISADGGDGDWPNGGGGGGGRVAIISTSSSFIGTVSARGGAGHVAGGAGTIYREVPRQFAQLILDNGGQQGTNTLVAQFSTSLSALVRGGAVLVPGSGLGSKDFNSLEVFPDSAVLVSNQWLRILGNAIVHAGGRIHADGMGYPPGIGPGAGSHTRTPKGGGSHGGLGALNPLAVASGSVDWPTAWGSGGANGSGLTNVAPLGGSGGGYLRLSVGGTLTVNGSITAHGSDGGLNSGGGAGGSVYLEDVSTLAGSGTIGANGGAGSGTGGGGGGGRVAIFCRTNLFTGTVTARGGAGAAAGGAGTICWKRGAYPWTATNVLLVVDNGGLWGTNTPLFGLTNLVVDLRVSGGAVAHPQTPLPMLNWLEIGPGGRLTHLPGQSGLELWVQNNLTIAPGGELTVRGVGHPANAGPGKGSVLNNQGGGGGHGGAGGASANGAAGGGVYGSETQPPDRGSGGGASLTGWSGSEGGGAVRVRAGGPVHVDGVITAAGNDGWVDDSGGGAGGSIWLAAPALTGGGLITAAGGAGEPALGGGGGGGRIAIYAPVNTFTGLVSVAGGPGANAGQPGTLFVTTNLPFLGVARHTPSGVVSNAVSFVDVTFDDVVQAPSVDTADFRLITPTGILPGANLSVTVTGLFTARVSFPLRYHPGEYRLEVGPEIRGWYGLPMSQVYTGAFQIAWLTISGTIRDTNNRPVPGVWVQPSGGWPGVRTDANGAYVAAVPPTWSGYIQPTLENFTFQPAQRGYLDVTNSVANQNFTMLGALNPLLSWRPGGTHGALSWQGITDMRYQIWTSTNLLHWWPWGEAIPGSNGWMEVPLPAPTLPQQFFRLEIRP